MQITAEKIPLALLSIFPIHIVVIDIINPQRRPGIKTVAKRSQACPVFPPRLS
jgi:hypothetical protein